MLIIPSVDIFKRPNLVSTLPTPREAIKEFIQCKIDLQYLDLSNIDLSNLGCSIDDIDFSNSNLDNTNLSGNNITTCKFNKIISSNISFENSYITDCKFINVKFNRANFNRSVIQICYFENIQFNYCNFMLCALLKSLFHDYIFYGIKSDFRMIDTLFKNLHPSAGFYNSNVIYIPRRGSHYALTVYNDNSYCRINYSGDTYTLSELKKNIILSNNELDVLETKLLKLKWLLD